MEKSDVNAIRIVVTGPESSGKTTLTLDLSEQLRARLVPEFSRFYLESLGRKYQQKDLELIARGQKLWENHASNSPNPIHVVDTDWTVLKIWEEVRFPESKIQYWKRGYGPALHVNLYVLCSPDIPWEADPLREDPVDRDFLFQKYHALLTESEHEFIIAEGSPEKRLNQVLEAIKKH